MGMNEEAIEEQDDPFSALRTEERARHEITWPPPREDISNS